MLFLLSFLHVFFSVHTYKRKILVLISFFRIVVTCCSPFSSFFKKTELSSSLLQRWSHNRKKTHVNLSFFLLCFFLFLNIHMCVFFLFSGFCLSWAYCLYLSVYLFFFRKLQSSDMCVYVRVWLYFGLGFTCTCVYDDQLVFHYKYFIRAYRWRQIEKTFHFFIKLTQTLKGF
jgi:hypothetical protein